MPDTKRKQKPAVSIIGAGRLGTTLALALSRKGYSIESLVARHAQTARKAARLLNSNTQAFAAKQFNLLKPADLFLIATPDDQVASVASELAKLDLDRKPAALHTSGALSAEVLSPLRKKGWSTGSIHPLVSVTDGGRAELRGAFWSVEGDKEASRIGRAIVDDLGGESFSIRSEDKPLYHAAAVMSAGNVVALFDVAIEMLVRCGLSRKTARGILQPLIASTVQNLETRDPVDALTGTFARGDIETVKLHIAALEKKKLSDATELYRLLGRRSLKLTKKKQPQISRILETDS
jgi:predicted short-subunit dehydrogenase-like oxidoreductase (DUF2520 family)